MSYVTEIHADDDSAISFNEEGKTTPEYFDDVLMQEAMEDENVRYAGVIRELTAFENLMQSLG